MGIPLSIFHRSVRVVRMQAVGEPCSLESVVAVDAVWFASGGAQELRVVGLVCNGGGGSLLVYLVEKDIGFHDDGGQSNDGAGRPAVERGETSRVGHVLDGPAELQEFDADMC
ncbi:hypothetical protein Ct61P_14665 [Colletotrichum tofieldiae]|nr:hypothetical protein Ct61P_14665 [Colletotrichum tofieldiae]